MTAKEWLQSATNTLQTAKISSARLDALLLLSDALRQSKAQTLAHLDATLSEKIRRQLDTQLQKRLQRVPMAYLRGYQEFYGRQFVVDERVLVPRPESETLIDELKKLQPEGTLADVGTGSGCLAITAALECPQLYTVFGLDISTQALENAAQNNRQWEAGVILQSSDLLQEFHGIADVIVANLPYVAKEWDYSAELNYEPENALFAPENGLALIKRMLSQAPEKLRKKGLLLLEADPMQHTQIIKESTQHGFSLLHTKDYVIILSKP